MYWLRQFFTRGGLHLRALTEVIVTTLFSLVPFVVPAFINMAKADGWDASVLEPLMGKGQLFLLSYGLFGSIFWLSVVQNETARHNARIFVGFITTILMLIVVGYSGFDPTFTNVVNQSVIRASYIFYPVVVFLYYLSIFYSRIDPPNAGDTLKRETNSMRTKFEEFSSEEQ